MSKKKVENKEKEVVELFPLGKENYKLMLIGLAIILLGFTLMIGGGSNDPNIFNEDIFSFRRITLAPMIVLFGFMFQIYAIMKKPKEDSEIK
jgi:membrane-bound ClpP family serine protease